MMLKRIKDPIDDKEIIFRSFGNLKKGNYSYSLKTIQQVNSLIKNKNEDQYLVQIYHDNPSKVYCTKNHHDNPKCNKYDVEEEYEFNCECNCCGSHIGKRIETKFDKCNMDCKCEHDLSPVFIENIFCNDNKLFIKTDRLIEDFVEPQLTIMLST